MEQTRITILCGPTASGKTALAMELATRYGAEIVSADSRQVYRHMDIGTAKPSPEQRSRVPHHLVDVVNPDQRFDAAGFQHLARAAVSDIVRRGKRVLVVGGTGLYIRALTRGLFRGPAANPDLRARLHRQELDDGKGSLHRRLREVDRPTAARLHPNDTVRLVRALEVYLLSGTPLSQWHRAHRSDERPFVTLTLALAVERDALAQRIEARCRHMIRDGLADELRHLWQLGYDPDLAPLRTIGYAQMAQVLAGESTVEDAIAGTAHATRRLAKRQLTWLRSEPGIRWFTPAQERPVAQAIERFYCGERITRASHLPRV